MTKGQFPRHSLPMKVGLSCGCDMRVSKRKYDYGEVWCYVHRQTSKIVRAVAVVPKAKGGPDGMKPLF